MSQVNISVDDALLQRTRDEAARSYQGELDATVTAALNYYLRICESRNDLAGQVDHQPGSTQQERIQQVLEARGVSADRLNALAAMLSGLATQSEPQASDIVNFLKPFQEWCAKDPSNLAGASIVSSQAGRGNPGQEQSPPPISYASGWLRAEGGVMTGDLRQWFSDRVSGAAADPFDPARSESLGLTIAVDDKTGLATITLTAHEWGNAQQTLTNLRLSDGLLLARGESVGNQTASALVALSLYTVRAPE